MAKHTPLTGPIDPKELKRRIRDEMEGINPGVDFGSKGEAAEVIPDMNELGLPLSVRKQLTTYVLSHVELGKIEREATKDRKAVTDAIKAVWLEHLSDEIPSFYCTGIKVSNYTQMRSSFSQDLCRQALVDAGVKPAVVAKAFEQATSKNPTVTLRITPPGESE